jgi:cytochrome P450
VTVSTTSDVYFDPYDVEYCVGSALARLEGRIALEEVLKRFPEWDVDMSGNYSVNPFPTTMN